MSEILNKLSGQGVAIWLDDISRERLRSGNLEQLIREKNVVGVTSNPTIFANALSKGDAYNAQLHDLAVRGVEVGEAVRAITTYDIRWAADVLRPAYDSTGGVDGRVSLEVDPRLARDSDKTVAEARALWWLVDRPNLFIKIPATVEGLPAITQALAEGISVNVTLIFSLERYRAVMDAWLAGLEAAQAKGLNLATIDSVASFFVSRVDTEIDKRLDKLGKPELKGKAGVANARLAYAAYEDVMNSERWQRLRAAGARPQRPLWASTGVKNPEYSDTLYVDQLVAPGTVNTMPEKTLDATADHANITGDTVRPFYEQAWNTMAALKEAGIDYDDVVQLLEDEGVEKFAASWNELLESVTKNLVP
ncbi:transaldolase [Nonomuraea phyllanthi]|uniref:Transaldolase n=1 Tax=Nonomuraea phyllanthi TaxID=2219224 RepID=A0A5C4WQI5_9ACTN|nr:transaldolase [Nonomuraea phyllanthi]KAB8195083.1 transaldolase [Nonomuraea phyllanthi]QFY10785.1 transaldolase [Nonomuraea phyllanthi]